MLSGSRASRETCNLCICFHKKQSQGRSQRVVVEPVSSLCLNPANGWPTWCLLSPVSLMAPSQVVFHEEELLGSRRADPVTRLEVNVQAIRTIVTGPEGDNAAITDGSVLFTRAVKRWDYQVVGRVCARGMCLVLLEIETDRSFILCLNYISYVYWSQTLVWLIQRSLW